MKTKKTCKTSAPCKTRECARAKRAASRSAGKTKRCSVRAKLRGACGVALACLSLLALGCATATPASKAQTSKACGNTITVNINLAVATNAASFAALPAGGVSISLSDLVGTQVQSADAGRDDTANLSATPTNTSGVTGDKPIEGLVDVGKTAITGGASSAVKAGASALKTLGSASAAAAATESAADCAAGTCPGK